MGEETKYSYYVTARTNNMLITLLAYIGFLQAPIPCSFWIVAAQSPKLRSLVAMSSHATCIQSNFQDIIIHYMVPLLGLGLMSYRLHNCKVNQSSLMQ